MLLAESSVKAAERRSDRRQRQYRKAKHKTPGENCRPLDSPAHARPSLLHSSQQDSPDSTSVDYVYDLVGKIKGVTDALNSHNVPRGTFCCFLVAQAEAADESTIRIVYSDWKSGSVADRFIIASILLLKSSQLHSQRRIGSVSKCIFHDFLAGDLDWNFGRARKAQDDVLRAVSQVIVTVDDRFGRVLRPSPDRLSLFPGSYPF